MKKMVDSLIALFLVALAVLAILDIYNHLPRVRNSDTIEKVK